MESPITFGQWIRQRRRILDLTQEELAGKIGCSVSAVRKIETGERRPSRQIVGLLAEALKIPPEDRPVFTKVARGERNLERLPQLADLQRPAASPPASRAVERFPVPLTPLVGREPELVQILQMLSGPQVRLLTLLGPGGIGKTRVAIETAGLASRDLAGLFPDGVFFAALEPLSSADYLITALAAALGFTFFGPEDPRVQLLQYLREKKLLLILDGFEALLDAADLLEAALQQAAGIKLLVTSRERLNLQAEWVFEIHGLPVPGGVIVDTPGEVGKYSALTLFAQTARRAEPSFRIANDNLEDILNICRALDGMPLGIELAASLVRALSCAEIAVEIRQNLDILRAPGRNVPERHRSLKAAFEYSWNLLPPEEQDALARLSVFRGVFKREAALQVAGAGINTLTSLVDKSLLRRVPGGYSLHDVVRQYAALHLVEDPQAEQQAFEEHSRYFLIMLRDCWDEMISPASKEVQDRLNEHYDNIRAAWDWAAAHRRYNWIDEAANSLYYLLEMRGVYLEGQLIFSETAEKLGGWEPPVAPLTLDQQLALGRVFCKEAYFNMRLGKQGQAEPLFNMSIALLRPVAAQKIRPAMDALSEALVFLSTAEYHMGRFDQARELAEEALALSRLAISRWNMAYALLMVGLIAHAQGHTETAYRTIQDSIFYSRQLGDPRNMILCLSFAGMVTGAIGKAKEAHTMLLEVLEISRAINDRWGVATALNHLGQVELSLGEEERQQAIAHLGESVAIYREMGEPWNMTRALVRLGGAYHLQGEDEPAREILVEAIRIAWASPVIPLALDAMFELAVILADGNAPDCALQLLAPLREHPQCYEETRVKAVRLWDELAARGGPPPAAHPDFTAVVEQVLSWALCS